VSYLVGILGLLFLVLVHELGHFLAAKGVGMRALRFYVGFPPPVVRKTIGDTEYGIGAIPLGGYVKIPGMLRPDEGDLWEVADLLERSDKLTPDEASAIAEAHDAIRAGLARGRYDEAAARLPELERALEAAAPHLGEREKSRGERALRRVAEALDPRAYWRAKPWKRVTVIAAGPLTNIVVAFLILVALGIAGMPQILHAAEPSRTVAAVQANTPAAKAGLKKGDVIVAIDGKPTRDFLDVRNSIADSKGSPIDLTVRRDGTQIVLRNITPERRQGRYVIGFVASAPPPKSSSVIDAPGVALDEMWTMVTASVQGVQQQGTRSVSSPVGIVKGSSTYAQAGVEPYLWLLAYLSLSLGVFNLLPFLPLDGGHLLMVGIEKLRGRPIPRSAFERVSAIGIALVLLVFLVGLNNDLFGPQPR
jgi:regulator of sigma E protease